MSNLDNVFERNRVTKQGMDVMIDNAKRYLWLRARPVEDCTTPRIEVNAWTCNVNDDGVSDSINEGNVLAGDALDAAIDAAMLGENT